MLRRRADVTEATAAGIKYTSKKILQYAVILLGFGLNLGEIAKVGASSLPIIVSTITPSLVISFVLCRVMHIPCRISTLVGVGSSICGGSAIAATAPVIDADDEEITQAISVIFLFNIIAALIFLSIGAILGMSNEGFGLFAGKRHYHRVRAAVAVTAPIKTLSKLFIVMAMAAIGFNTDVVKLVKTGAKSIFMGLCCWIAITCVSLGIQSVLGIW